MKRERKVPRRRFREFQNDEAWKECRLKDVIDVNSGCDYKHLSKGNIPVYGTGGYMLSVDKALSYDQDAIGIGRKGTIDKPYILKAPFWTVDTLFYAIPLKGNDLQFIYDIFQIINWKQKDESTGVPSLSKVAINDIKINIPIYNEQNKIGKFINKLDNIILGEQQKLEKLKALKKAYLTQMFPSAGECKPKLRFAGFDDEWEQRKLGDIMEITSVKRIHQSDWAKSGVRFLRARDIVAESKHEEIKEPLFISEEKYKEYSVISGKVQAGDMLVTGVGTIGIPMLITSNFPLYFKDGNIIWFKNENRIDGRFFYYSFISEYIQSFINESSGIGTVGTYTIDCGKRTPIILPSIEEQKKIGQYFYKLDTLITFHQRKLQKLQNLKKAYLNEMFI
ncbi:MAG TPA: restriction endonuclease subunit S [Clostridium sp.]|nr:restriction endonuclease subunit S [Clostridium sp.]